MARLFILILALIVLINTSLFILAGCGILDPSSYDDLIITTDRKVYASDDSVKVNVINKTGETLHYNLCLNDLLFFKGDTVIAINNPDICQLISRTLRPGETVTTMIALQSRKPLHSSSLELGMYRIRFNAISDKKDKDLPEKNRVSNTFEITQ